MLMHERAAVIEALDFRTFWESELKGFIVSRTGTNWKARSPFREDRNPSFSADVVKGLWNDFALGGGDICKFVMLRYRVSFPQALQYLEEHYPGGARPLSLGRDFPTRCKQAIPAQEYPPESFRYFERVEGPLSGRKAGCMVQGSGLLLDFYSKPIEAYASAFLFPPQAVEYHHKGNLKGGVGSLAGYSGPVRASALFFDLDCKDDPGKALWDLASLLLRLEALGSYSPEKIRVFFSGNKGFHALVLDSDLEKLPASEDFPARIEATCRKLAGDLPTFDGKVYDKTRLLRAINSRHPKTHLFKIPLTLREIDDPFFDISKIFKLAENQRQISPFLNSSEPIGKGRALCLA